MPYQKRLYAIYQRFAIIGMGLGRVLCPIIEGFMSHIKDLPYSMGLT
jgi:hypothetical protein